MTRTEQIVIPILWLIWLGYWIYAGLRTKPVERRETSAARAIYLLPLLVGGILLGMSQFQGTWLGERIFVPGPGIEAISIALVALGLGFAILARMRLGTNWSATVTLKRDHELIRTGPYAVTRHPIYTGLLIAVLGSAVAVGEARGLIAFGLIALSMVFKLRGEERFMTDQFGDTYRRYKKDVPALIPWVARLVGSF